MREILVFMVTLLAVHALTEKGQWDSFKSTHNKVYQNVKEDAFRFEVFQKYLQKIEEHNARYEKGEVTWFMKVDRFSDWTEGEIRHFFNNQKTRRPKLTNVTYATFPKNLKVPDSMDWRQHNAVREVKDQGNCGSCWSFSTTGSVEGQIALKKNMQISLSEQQLVDCSGSDNGCNGGWVNNALNYIRDNGIMSEGDYSYVATQGNCRYDANRVVTRISGQTHVQRMNEWDMLQASGTVGPLSVGINAPPIVGYGGGIFDVDGCPNGDGDLNHAVLAVGYGSENGLDYWIVKNSWGVGFGEQGYIRMRRGKNLCGIAVDPCYPEF
ncbi:cathepsin L-like proteinase [Diabrotica undecimpunctata]|uniref:cathepsin L-like proteinase n=1 Tax=Diabrotica undecimpunctata TaxID=50387 RepID=UPI003B632093